MSQINAESLQKKYEIVCALQKWVSDRGCHTEPVVQIRTSIYEDIILIDGVTVWDSENSDPLTVESCKSEYLDHCQQIRIFQDDVNENDAPLGCSGDESNCPENEGYGCFCTNL